MSGMYFTTMGTVPTKKLNITGNTTKYANTTPA